MDGRTDDGLSLVRNYFTLFSKEKSGYNHYFFVHEELDCRITGIFFSILGRGP